MITLITGQPGAGKTLRLLYIVKALAEKENRPVYVSGIPELSLPWIELDKPEEWYNCPVGSIIVIDECQRIFRPRGNGSVVPRAVSEMETHRHHGIDIFLTTQHPMLLDSNVRRLVGRHIHVMRAFGAGAANIHEWNEVRENCDKSRLGSQCVFWKYPKEVFSYYKSAELHTHRFRPPLRILLLIVAPVLLGVAVWSFLAWYQSYEDKGKAPVAAPVSVSATAPSSVPSPLKGSEPPRLSRESWLADYTPRLDGLPHTAPAYDRVTLPVDAPYPVGCARVSSCVCYTAQGTQIPMAQESCEAILKTGFFRSWSSDRRREVTQ
ncbi:Zonular occludens toxin [Rhodocyclus tenuis]|uniref:Zonular occludens toxin n=1 Tax=Rhodocyclus gracilis TaxID=2929842 RepID=A0ABX0WKJ2_9RHOO|nr:zonular occludens toxin domain-containing protein [Rhodocyclus gracilis]NJA90235.1 Zonular occludens toxin [Rhodocyclus gracilis]